MMFRFLLALSLTAVLVGCGSTRYTSPDPAVTIMAETEDMAFVRTSIIESMQRRRFTALVDEPGRLVGRYDRGEISFDVEVIYSESRYDVRYLDLGTLPTEADPTGEIFVDDRYRVGLVRYIGKVMKKARKRERAAARDRARADARWNAEQHRRQVELERARNPGTVVHQPVIAPVQEPAPAAPSYGIVKDAIDTFVPPVKIGGSYDSSTRRSDQSLTCCINGSKYKCPGQAAFDQCVTTDPSACTPAGGC